MKFPEPKPYWVFKLWCQGAGDQIAAYDAMNDPEHFPIHPMRLWLWRIRGAILHSFLFEWWVWQ